MPGLHPLLHLAVLQPQLLLEHVEAYAVLLAAEGSVAASRLRRQVVWHVLACVGLTAGLVLAGVSILAWALLPRIGIESAWLLWAVPLVPLLCAGGAMLAASRANESPDFAAVRRHAKADLELLRATCATGSAAAGS